MVHCVSFPPTINLVFASQKKSKADEEKYYDGKKLHFLTNLPDPFFPKKKPTPYRLIPVPKSCTGGMRLILTVTIELEVLINP